MANITSTGERKQIDYVVENGCIELLLKHLKADDKTKSRVALEGLENILKCYDGEDENEFVLVKKIEELNGIFFNLFKEFILFFISKSNRYFILFFS